MRTLFIFFGSLFIATATFAQETYQFTSQIDLEATRLAYMTDEAKEGRDAFLEKRAPNFDKKWLP
jgi:1,4-dihydroxy-2-naphthoyl-CoA synthase